MYSLVWFIKITFEIRFKKYNEFTISIVVCCISKVLMHSKKFKMITNKHNTMSTACHKEKPSPYYNYNNIAFAWRKIVIYIVHILLLKY